MSKIYYFKIYYFNVSSFFYSAILFESSYLETDTKVLNIFINLIEEILGERFVFFPFFNLNKVWKDWVFLDKIYKQRFPHVKNVSGTFRQHEYVVSYQASEDILTVVDKSRQY